ncbi:MAG: hypothetical protein ACYDEE_06615 [Ignavibacteriaceae bacterium]
MKIKFLLNFFTVTAVLLLFSNNQYAQDINYPELTKPIEIIHGDKGKWDENNTHTLTVLEVNKGGYKYWGYYGLNHYGNFAPLRNAGLVRSNDLVHWVKYGNNPIIKGNCRWPTAVLAHNITYIFFAEYDTSNNSRIVMESSKDGIHFGNKIVVVPEEDGKQNQNPFIYYDKKDGNFYLVYYTGIERSTEPGVNNWNIALIKSKDIYKLKNAKPKILLSAKTIIASPSLAYFNSKYYLLIEAKTDNKWDNKWVTLAYQCNKINGSYTELDNNPILPDNDACAFQYVFNNQLYIFYSHSVNEEETNWVLNMVKAIK